jgi:nucleotide-binding universal stress UspA family protein
MKVLCGIDGYAHSTTAAAAAMNLAKRLGAQLTLYMVNPALPGRGARFYLWSDDHVRKILSEAGRRGRWSGVADVRCASQRARNIADAIVDYADEHEVDYIVVGASDRPAVLKLLSGSVSREVVAKANCPVVVVRRNRDRSDRRHRGGRPEPVVFHDIVPAVA